MTKNSLESGIFSNSSPAAGLDLVLFNFYKTKLGKMVMETIIIAINVWKMALEFGNLSSHLYLLIFSTLNYFSFSVSYC